MPSVRRFVAILVVAVAACGGHATPPERGVLEGQLGGWTFRRYQRLLDVEVWVQDNPAIAHGASYVRTAAERRGHLSDADVASAVVTRYRTSAGVDRALVELARRLAHDASYTVEERSIQGVRLFTVTGGGEAWALWSAHRHVVKIGGPRRTDVPEDLIEAYGERYPSRIAAGALEGPLPPGPTAAPRPEPVREPAGKAR
jgi:hypothetical protein